MTTNLFLLINFVVFILIMCLTFFLVKFTGAKVTYWALILVAATPILNVVLLGLLIYETLLIHRERR